MCGKITKLVKDPQEHKDLKKVLKDSYKLIRETYRYHAGVGLANGVPAIGMNVMTDIVTQANILDGKVIKISDIDVEFIATNVSALY